jgi:hypothetical protein
MKSHDYDAVTYDASVYCIGCLPEGVGVLDEEVSPIFADSEWDSYPVCDACGAEHDYVNLTHKEPDYSKMTDEEFEEILEEKVSRMTASEILSIGEVNSILREHLNNEILETWANNQSTEAP